MTWLLNIWNLLAVVTISITLMVCDPDFDPDENCVEGICTFMRSFWPPEPQPVTESFWLAALIQYLVVGYCVGRSILNVALGWDED